MREPRKLVRSVSRGSLEDDRTFVNKTLETHHEPPILPRKSLKSGLYSASLNSSQITSQLDEAETSQTSGRVMGNNCAIF